MGFIEDGEREVEETVAKAMEEIRRWLQENVSAEVPIDAAMALAIQREVRDKIAKRYSVPESWVTLVGVKLTENGLRLEFEGFLIKPPLD